MAPTNKTYKCLNPVGNQEPVDTYPLAKRLDKLGHLGAAGETVQDGFPGRQLDGKEEISYRPDGAYRRGKKDHGRRHTRRLLVTWRCKQAVALLSRP